MDGGRESPAVKKAKMDAMATPTVVHEHWDQQALIREVARMKAQLHVLTDYAQTLGMKHNLFVDDTAAAMMTRKMRIEQAETRI